MEDKDKKQELVPQEFEKLPAEVRANMLSSEKSIFFNVALFEQANRIAVMFAKSTMVPDHFRDNVGNCMIALNYAMRLQADPFMVMQCLYVVHGRPGVEGKLIEAIINQSAKYSQPLEYEWLDPEDKPIDRRTVLNHKDFGEFGCQAWSIDAKSNKKVTGPKITWKLVKAEGWYDKSGSKWKTMAEMMFIYRSASWFSNKNCPELKLGMHTVEELQDIVDLRPSPNGSYGVPGSLNDKLKGKPQAEAKEDMYEAKVASESDKKETVEEPKENPVRAAYIKLQKKGFKPYVEANLQAIGFLPEKYQTEIRAKWQKFDYGEPFPGDETVEKVEEAESPTDETDDDRFMRLVDGAEENVSGLALNCPETEKGVRVLKVKCEGNCNSRKECKSWKDYDKESG